MWINFGLVALGAFLTLVFGWVREGVEADRENKLERQRRADKREADMHDMIEEAMSRVRQLESRVLDITGRADAMRSMLTRISKKVESSNE